LPFGRNLGFHGKTILPEGYRRNNPNQPKGCNPLYKIHVTKPHKNE
jgi:hypothetical protein